MSCFKARSIRGERGARSRRAITSLTVLAMRFCVPESRSLMLLACKSLYLTRCIYLLPLELQSWHP